MAWRFKNSDLCSCAEGIIRKMETQNGVVFDSYYLPRDPQLDVASENIENAIRAMLADNVKREILHALPEADIGESQKFEIKLDTHIDAAAGRTIFSGTLRDEMYGLFENGRIISLPRQVFDFVIDLGHAFFLFFSVE